MPPTDDPGGTTANVRTAGKNSADGRVPSSQEQPPSADRPSADRPGTATDAFGSEDLSVGTKSTGNSESTGNSDCDAGGSRPGLCEEDPLSAIAGSERKRLGETAQRLAAEHIADDREAAEFRSLVDTLLEASSDCIKVLSLDATLQRMNDTGVRAFGRGDVDGLIGTPWIDLWPEESHQAIGAALDIARGGQVGRFKAFCPNARKEPRWWDGTISPVRDDRGRPVKLLSVSRDITEQVLTERKAEAAKARAEDAARAKSEFLSNMSHEIRSPLAAIIGYSELLHLTDPKDIEKLDVITRNGRFLLSLVSDVIDLSRIEAGQVQISREPFSPVRLAEEILSLMSVRAGSGLELVTEYVGRLPDEVYGDVLRVRQVLMNLVGNALKFTDEGEVRLRLRYQGPDKLPGDETPAAGESEPNGILTFEVSDTGIGIKESQQERIFDAFLQTDTSSTRRYGGSGLGLAISRELAHLMDGTITVTSQLGLGSTFAFRLPVADRGLDLQEVGQGRSRLPGGQPREEHPKLPIRVLVVDDRADMRFMAQLLIESVGGDVVLADSGLKALDTIEKDRQIDAVLMDVQMPVMDGMTATRKLRESGCELPIIALTANAMEEDRQRCLQTGFTDYLPKPVDFSELINCLRSHTLARRI